MQEKIEGFFLVHPEVNLQKYSNILWLFILGRSLVTHIIFFMQVFLHHTIPHPVLLKKQLQKSKHCTSCVPEVLKTPASVTIPLQASGSWEDRSTPLCSAPLGRLQRVFLHGKPEEKALSPALHLRPWLLCTVPKWEPSSYPRYGHWISEILFWVLSTERTKQPTSWHSLRRALGGCAGFIHT